MPHSAGVGVITGITTEDGIPCSKRVVLVDRSNLTVVARTQSDENGKYVFNGLNTETNDYLVFGVDDDEPLKNAEIHDHIKPISGHQGATYPYNWLWLVLRKNPTNVFIGQTVENSLTGYSINYINTYGVVLPNVESQMPYAPAFPMTELNVGKIIQYGFNSIRQETDVTETYTFEWVMDLSSETIGLLYSNYFRMNDYSYLFYTFITYQKGLLRVGYKTGVSSEAYPVTLITHNMPDNGVAHIVVTYDFSRVCRLFVNGELVAEQKITDNKIINNPRYIKNSYLIVNSKEHVNNYRNYLSHTTGGIGKVGVIAHYYAVLSEEEIKEHYNALFTETLPRLTGFVKEIFVDNPCFLYRINESDIARDGIVDYLTNSKKMTVANANGVTPNQESVIVGGFTAMLNGTYFTGSNPYFTISSYGFTFECVLRIDTDATVEQTLFSQSVDNIVIKRLKTTGNIEVSYPLSSQTEKVSFAPLPQNELLHICIVVDKINNYAVLYANGEVVEKQSISNPPIILNTIDGNNVKKMIVGQNFIGCIGDVVLYPKPLSEERILAHFDATDIL